MTTKETAFRQIKEFRKMLSLKCLQLRIIVMPQWHILNPFRRSKSFQENDLSGLHL